MDYVRNSQKWHLLNLFFFFPIKIADYLVMTVTVAIYYHYMPMWKIITHVVAFSVNQEMPAWIILLGDPLSTSKCQHGQ